jgi:hypothetical protein
MDVEVVVVCFKVLSLHLLGEFEENNKATVTRASPGQTF